MSSRSQVLAEGVGVPRLVACVALAVFLMVLDRRFAALDTLRSSVRTLAQPLYLVAEAPARLGRWLRFVVIDRSELADENSALRAALIRSQSEAIALQARIGEIERVEVLLKQAQAWGLEGQYARVYNLELSQARARVRIDRGSRDGISVGMAALDAYGVFGQVESVSMFSADVLLVTDADHAVPVQVLRSGLRTIVTGTGRAQLMVPSLQLTADVRDGDVLIASGLGGRFPFGYPVGTVSKIVREPGAAFLSAQVEPSARTEISREVLLTQVQELVGPPVRLAPAETPP